MLELVDLWKRAMDVADLLIETSGPLSSPETWPSWVDEHRAVPGEAACPCSVFPDVPGWSATLDAMERAEAVWEQVNQSDPHYSKSLYRRLSELMSWR